MLAVPSGTGSRFRYDNLQLNPSNVPGTTVIPGASNALGAWTQLASNANIAQDIDGFYIQVTNGGTSGQIKQHLLDIGVDPAGGTSYTPVISNLVCGNTPAGIGRGAEFFFPLRIRAGSSVAVRVRGSNATAGTVRVQAMFYGQLDRPEAFKTGSFTETIGTITNSLGHSFTPSNNAVETWTALGTTTERLWWWQFGHQINNSTITAQRTYLYLAYGDGSNKHIITKKMHFGTTGETVGPWINPSLVSINSYCDVPAGSTIYIGARCHTTPNTGYNAVAVGVGG